MQKNRDNSIDLLRGIAIIFMVASHVVWVFDPGINGVWDILRDIADNISFVIFLFAFGFGTYFSLFINDGNEVNKKHLERVFSIVKVYLALNLLTILLKWLNEGFDSKLILDFLLLRYMAGLTEFLIPFIILGLVSFMIKRYVRSGEISLTILFAFLAFSLGVLGYNISGTLVVSNEWSDGFWSVLFGHVNFYLRFPVFQYFSIFIFGAIYAYYTHCDIQNRSRYVLILTLMCFFILIMSYQTIFVIDPVFNTQRFPVHLGFLAQNLLISVIILILIKILSKYMPDELMNILTLIGQSSLGIMFFHVLALLILEYSNFPKNTGETLLLLPVYLIALCSFFIYKYLYKYIMDKKLYPRNHS